MQVITLNAMCLKTFLKETVNNIKVCLGLKVLNGLKVFKIMRVLIGHGHGYDKTLTYHGNLCQCHIILPHEGLSILHLFAFGFKTTVTKFSKQIICSLSDIHNFVTACTLKVTEKNET